MVSVIVALIVLIASLVPAQAGQAAQTCLSCHPSHYAAKNNCTGCHRGNPTAARKNIAHQGLIPGRYAAFSVTGQSSKDEQCMVQNYGCRRCHVISGKGNRLAANLDLTADRKEVNEIVSASRRPTQGMPDFRLSEDRVTLLVSAILAGQSQGVKPERPRVVHFSSEQGRDVFTRKCGYCHKALSQLRGLIGSGEVGPNLSSLFSPYYPAEYKAGQGWTGERLEKWLQNPRSVRQWSGMPPVELSDKELRELVEVLTVR